MHSEPQIQKKILRENKHISCVHTELCTCCFVLFLELLLAQVNHSFPQLEYHFVTLLLLYFHWLGSTCGIVRAFAFKIQFCSSGFEVGKTNTKKCGVSTVDKGAQKTFLATKDIKQQEIKGMTPEKYILKGASLLWQHCIVQPLWTFSHTCILL